jgi:hypothetical protein
VNDPFLSLDLSAMALHAHRGAQLALTLSAFADAVANAIAWTGSGAIVVGTPAALEMLWLPLRMVPPLLELMEGGQLRVIESAYLPKDGLLVLPHFPDSEMATPRLRPWSQVDLDGDVRRMAWPMQATEGPT